MYFIVDFYHRYFVHHRKEIEENLVRQVKSSVFDCILYSLQNSIQIKLVLKTQVQLREFCHFQPYSRSWMKGCILNIEIDN